MGALTDRWVSAMQSGTAQAKYSAKINAVTENPMELAAQAVESGKYMQGVNAAVNSGKMTKKLRAVNVATWKQIASTIGAQNMANGAKKGQAKMAAAEATIVQAGQAAKQAARAAGGSSMNRIQAALQAVKSTWGYGSL